MINTMNARCFGRGILISVALLLGPALSPAGPASDALPTTTLLAGKSGPTPVPNAAFHPGSDALTAPAFAGILHIQQSPLRAQPAIDKPVQDGRDARLFPGIVIELFTVGDLLVPVQRGEMVRETALVATPSYWRVIPQIGRVWREKADGDWSRAALPLMLVNDTENHAHQGLATFLYQGARISDLALQFVQQTAPYLLGRHFVAWGSAHAELLVADAAALEERRGIVRQELAARLPAKPWVDLLKTVSPGTLDGFGEPLQKKWRVTAALVRDGTLYYQESETD